MKIISPVQLMPQLLKLYADGLPPGFKTGWPEVDKLYTVAPGMVTVLTGWPGSGKSEWLDALMLNLKPQGWKFVVFSPENLPLELHISKWLEKLWNKPFRKGRTERMTIDEAREGADEFGQHFRFLAPRADEPITVTQIIDDATTYFDDDISGMQRGLIIDPWNELEHARPGHISETEYVGYTLGMLRAWARGRKVHVWIVAHPQKLRRIPETGKLPIPTPDTISGSQHFWNKADCCITVQRDLADPKNPDVEIHVQKVRFKHIGKAGLVTLRYDRLTGRYHQIVKGFTVVKDDDDE